MKSGLLLNVNKFSRFQNVDEAYQLQNQLEQYI